VKRDPDKVVNVSDQRRDDWDAKISEGALVPLVGTAGPGEDHIQGRRTNAHDQRRRVIPSHVAGYIATTGYYPPGFDSDTGQSTRGSFGSPAGGWPTFGPGGKIL